jgi:anti-sigma B factor antagonist
MFRFDKQQREDWTLLSLQGSLDALTSGALKAQVVELAQHEVLRVVVDMSGLNLIDSTGVGVLISLFKRARAAGGAVHFAGLGGQPKEIFRLLRLDRSLDLFPSVSEAADKLQKA